MSKKIYSALFLISIIIFLYITSAIHDLFRAPLVKEGITTSIKVFPNQGAHTLTLNLYDQKLIRHPLLFEWLIDISGDRFHLRYGEYEIKYPMSAWKLLKNIVHGTDLVKHRLTIVNGWTFNQILGALSSDPDLNQ